MNVRYLITDTSAACDRQLVGNQQRKCPACRAEYRADCKRKPPAPRGTSLCLPPDEQRRRNQLVACYAAKHAAGMKLFE